MDVDWEVEIGGDAPVIEAAWPGLVDLRAHPDRICEIAEAGSFLPLARLLALINGAGSPFWTSKCDLWQPEPLIYACYVDVLPTATSVFADWREAESFCRASVARMSNAGWESASGVNAANGLDRSSWKEEPDIGINLVVRAAIAVNHEGFGITAYMSARGKSADGAKASLAQAMDIFADALLSRSAPPDRGSTLK